MNENRLIIPRNDISIVKARTVEVPLKKAAIGAQSPFLLDEVLNPKANGSVIFTGMEVFTATQQSKSNSGRPTITAAEAAKVSIVLMWGNEELIFQSPYIDFLSLTNYGMIRRLKGLKISLTSSYILNMDTLNDDTMSALVTFFYRPK